jgi:hypothetical protein
MLDVSVKLIRFVAGLLRKERKALGTRKNTRALTCWYQAVFAIAWFRDQPDIARHAVDTREMTSGGVGDTAEPEHLRQLQQVMSRPAVRDGRSTPTVP